MIPMSVYRYISSRPRNMNLVPPRPVQHVNVVLATIQRPCEREKHRVFEPEEMQFVGKKIASRRHDEGLATL